MDSNAVAMCDSFPSFSFLQLILNLRMRTQIYVHDLSLTTCRSRDTKPAWPGQVLFLSDVKVERTTRTTQSPYSVDQYQPLVRSTLTSERKRTRPRQADVVYPYARGSERERSYTYV